MNVRTTILAAALAASALPAAFANDYATGEIGYNSHPEQAASGLTREQVRTELTSFVAHPVLSDGSVLVGGEAGTVGAIEGAFADRQPDAPHTHVLGNTGGPRESLRGYGSNYYHGQ